MKITRRQLKKLIMESIIGIGSESYPSDFPDSLKAPGMRVICIWSQEGSNNGVKLTFLQSPVFGESTFRKLFNNDLALNGAYVVIPEDPKGRRFPASAQIVIENGNNVGNILDMLRTSRKGFEPFTHIIDIKDLYDGTYVGELNDSTIKLYCPGWSPGAVNDDEEYFI